MKEKLKKLCSRKFLLAFLGGIGGAAAAFTGLGGKVGTIAAIVVSGASLITYVVTEGAIDAKAVNQAIEIVKDVQDVIEKENKNETK